MSSNRPSPNTFHSPKSRSQKVRPRDGDLFGKSEHYREKSAERPNRHHASPHIAEDVTLTEHENSNLRNFTPSKRSSPLKKNYLSPHNQTPASASRNYQNSPSVEQFYTPLRTDIHGGTSSNEGSFVTPMTSQKPSFVDRTRTPDNGTPTNRMGMVQGYEYRRLTQELLDERMNKSFEKLKKAFMETGVDNRPSAKKTELPGTVEYDSQSDKFSLLDSVEHSPKSSTRHVESPKPRFVESVSQERVIMTKMKVDKESKDMSYVQTLCCAMEMQRKYADEAEKMEKQLDQLDMLKEQVLQMESSSKNAAEYNERVKKIEFLKDKLNKIVEVRRLTHQVQSVLPYVVDEPRYVFFEQFMGLNSKDFEKNVKNEKLSLSKELNEACNSFRKAKKAADEKRENRTKRRQSGPRESMPLKIKPVDVPVEANVSKRDVETQVTSRLDISTSPSVSEKPTTTKLVEIEPLDLTGLDGNLNNKPEKNEETMENVIGSINLKSNRGENEQMDLNRTHDESVNLNMSIGENSFFNASDVAKRFETHYPSRPNSSHDETPRSARSSMDPTSARRFSDGVAHFLEKHLKKDEEEAEDEVKEEKVEVEEIIMEKEPIEVDEKKEKEEENEIEEVEDEEGKNNVFVDDEGDETKKFLAPQEYEDVVENEEAEESNPQDNTVFEEASINEPSFNDSADDSGFLLNNKPPPRLKSILDSAPASSSSSIPAAQVDTPRRDFSPPVLNDTSVDVDVDFVCRHDLLPIMTDTMVNKAIELQSKLKGKDWVTALDVWDPMSLLDFGTDQPESFESFWILVWGKVVGLINEKYLKFDVKMSSKMEEKFREEAGAMVVKTFGLEAKNAEWHEEIQLNKKLQDLMIFGVDYRHEQRKNKPMEEQQMYRFTQLQMQEVSLHYTREKLDAQIQDIIEKDKENLASFQMNSEIERILVEEGGAA